ncbi:MAG: TetR/AcrR family transcriptional regulator [Myxococcales bacterium]|nr:TetR/AcrR family transcriptional regulator [Myxococcales bacterium]
MPKIVDADAVRNELLSKAAVLFARRGYGSLTIREIATEAGVSTGTLYHYFKGKEDLFRQLCAAACDWDIRTLGELRATHADPGERLEVFLEWTRREETYVLGEYLVLLDYLRAVDAEGAKVLVRETMERFTRAMAEDLELDPALARFILNFLAGLVLHRFLDGARTDWDEQLAVLRAALGRPRASKPRKEIHP